MDHGSGPRTLVERLLATAADHADRPALQRIYGHGGVRTWGEVADEVARVASGLRALGVTAGDHVLLLLPNRPEFHVVDLAVVTLGAVPVSAYGSSSVDRLAYVIEQTSAAALVAAGPVEAQRLRDAAERAGLGDAVVVVLDNAGEVHGATSFEDLTEADPLDLAVEAADRSVDHVAVLLFTSGTSGNPKGVPLTHRHLDAATCAFTERVGCDLTGLRQLSYLPMAHIGERFATHYLALAHGTHVHALDDLTALHDAIRTVRPHFLFGAPRMWELLHDAARHVGEDPLATMGLDEVVVAIVGSAPLPRHVHEYWLGQGVPLADFYGQSESTGMGSWSPDDIRPGTCGRALPGVELRIAGDGEIQVRGPNVFDGYHGAPDATARAFTQDGWYRTGDLGRLADGNLVVTARMGDTLVPTSGHNVAPAPLEHSLVRADVVSHACVVGTGRPHLAVVIALDHLAARELVRDTGDDPDAVTSLADHPAVVAAVDRAVATANEGRPRAESIRSVVVVEDQWLPGTSLVTPTNKLRRAAVVDTYAKQIDRAYAEERHPATRR